MSIKNKVPIIILGMHRSGTSCLAGSLQESGIYFGDVSTENKYNKKGNRENNDVMALNQSILENNNGSWRIPPNNIKWTQKHELEASVIVNHFENQSTHSTWGFKDPRTLLTFSFWNKILPNAALVGTVRSPQAVALSLNARDPNISITDGLQLWFYYNKILLSLLKTKPFPLISFDLNQKDYTDNLSEIIFSLGISHNLNNNFFEQKLRTSPQETTLKIPPIIKSCYRDLLTFT